MGVQHRVSVSTLSDPCSQIYRSIPCTGTFSSAGDRTDVVEECYRGGGPSDPGVLLHFLLGAKKRWRPEACPQSQGLKQVYSDKNIQNADTPKGDPPSEAGRLAGITGLERRIFSCPDNAQTPTFPSICLPVQGLPVQSPPIRDCNSSQGLYKDTSTTGGLHTPAGHSYVSIPGRLPNSGQVQRNDCQCSTEEPLDLTTSRLPDKCQEITVSSFPEVGVFGSGVGFSESGCSSTIGQSHEFDTVHSTIQSSRSLQTSEAVSPFTGSHGGIDTDGAVCSAVHEASPTIPQFSVGCQTSVTGSLCDGTHQTSPNHQLVEQSSQSDSGQAMVSGEAVDYTHNRRFSSVMGRACQRTDSAGSLDTTPARAAYQSFGIDGCDECLESISVPSSGQVSTDPDGQYDCHDVHQQTRGHQVTGHVSTDMGPVNVVHMPSDNTSGSAYFGGSQYSGRPSVKKSQVSSRVGTEQVGGGQVISTVVHSPNRFVCDVSEQETAPILFPAVPSTSQVHRCTGDGLERVVRVRFSSPAYSGNDIRQDSQGEGDSDFDSAYVDQERVVPSSSGSTHRLSQEIATPSRSGVAGERLTFASQSGIVSPSGLAGKRNCLVAAGLSQAAAATCMAARRPSTRRNYQSGWNHFSAWCRNADIDPDTATVSMIVSYLQHLLDSGRKFNTVKARMSAIAAEHPGTTFKGSLGTQSLVRKFLKGAFIEHPPIKDRFPTWDLPTVLEAMMKHPFEPIESIPLDMLTLKTVFLLAICSAKRIGELKALDCSPQFMSIGQRGVTLRPHLAFMPKVASLSNIEHVLEFAPYGRNEDGTESPQAALCICRTLQAYLNSTKPVRQSNQLLVTYKRGDQGRAASKQSIAAWLKLAIWKAYELQGKALENGTRAVKAHSVRGQSVSWADLHAVDVLDICMQANWSSSHTFIKHYRLALPYTVSANHAVSVLKALPARS